MLGPWGATDVRRTAPAVAACLLTVALSSCANRQADASPPATAPAPVATAEPTGPISIPQTQVELPPPQPVPEGAVPPRVNSGVLAGPPVPENRAPEPQAAPPTPTQTAQDPAPSALPQLGRLLTAAQRREYNRVISENVLAAEASLDLLRRRPGASSRQSEVNRVRAFLSQVEGARGSDLELARSLSERARLLAENLVRNSQ